MTEHLVLRLAWEWFQADGPKTRERLLDILLRQADVYNLDDTMLAALAEQAHRKFTARYGLKE